MFVFKKSMFGLLGLCFGHLATGQGTNSGAQKSFNLSGSVGASANFYSSNETVKTRPSFAWNLYGNMVGRTGRWTLPLSFVVNQFNNSRTSPYIQAGISPTYQWARFHLGYRYILFSPLTYEGQSFRGVGVELYPKGFRFAAFYGRLNKAVNEDTSSSRFRSPQYSRTGYGLKIGIGNERRFFDLIYFHAKDDSSSALLLNPFIRNVLHAKENAILGTAFKLTIRKRLIFSGDGAISGMTQDLAQNKIRSTPDGSLKKLVNRFLHSNASTDAGYAGQASLSYYNRSFNSSFSYRRVEPNFRSLGTPYIATDIVLASWQNNVYLLKGKLNVRASFSDQHNNLKKTLKTETRTRVSNINLNTILGQHVTVNLNFTGYRLKQKHGTPDLPTSPRLNDSFLLHQQMSLIGFSPSYQLTKGKLLHLISTNLTWQSVKDKSLSTIKFGNSKNFSSSLNYTLGLTNKPYSFSLNTVYSRYEQNVNTYTSFGPTLGLSAQLLKRRNWNLQGNFGYFQNRFNQNSSLKNITYSGSTSYFIRHHSFTVSANYMQSQSKLMTTSEIEKIPMAIVSKNLSLFVSYNHSF